MGPHSLNNFQRRSM